MGRFNTAIFDLDGTLLDTIADLRTAVAYALGTDEKTVTYESVLMSVNYGVRHLVSGVAKTIGLADYDIDSAMEKFISKYDECYDDKTKPYDGIPELLGRLKADGYKIAVFSNKADAFVKHLCRVKFAENVIDCSRGEVEGIPAKPAPDGAMKVMETLGITDKNKVAYVGDSDIDVLTAKNSGFYCIGVSWGYRDKELLIKTGADVIADDTQELYSIITQ